VETLRITEIFYSLQGETRTVGLPTAFVRLTGCPLRCQYCDTSYAFQGGQQLTLDEILSEVAALKPLYVTVTGGEPLAQKGCGNLLTALCDAGYQVSLETGGMIDISVIDARVVRVVDIKTPDSDEAEKNKYSNIQHLTDNDQVKFVLCSEQDYVWAKQKIDEYKLADCCGDILFSPSHGQLDARSLADWILRDHLPVRLQLQLHKILWGNQPGK